MLTRPAASAATVISMASSAFSASGFSQKTGLPPATSASVVALWTPSGVELIAASKPPQAMASSRLAEGVGDGVGPGEVAGALGVGVDGRDDLAAGQVGEALGVVARDGAGAEDQQALVAVAHR